MKKFLILMSILALSIPAYAASFPDVDESDTYYEAVEFLYTENIVAGNSDGSYAPDRVLNRAELMKVIAEGAATYYGWSEGIFDPYHNTSCFNDVAAGEWYTKYICYAKEMGWVVGYEDGTVFKPSQDVSFTEGLKIAYMGFGLEYTENEEVWYKDVVENASMHNYIPFTITAFNEGLQRDAMADLVTRIIKYEAGELETYLGDRADIVVTYNTIEAGEDLSELIEDEVAVDEEGCEYDGEIYADGESYSIGCNSCSCSYNEETGIYGAACTEIGCEEVVEETEVETEVEEEEEQLEEVQEFPEPVTHTISIDNMEFIDGTINITVGDSITWNNNDSMAHTVDIESADSSGTIAAGASFSYTFQAPGTFTYLCALHPSMTGTITVDEQ